jgi:hypothetical protein
MPANPLQDTYGGGPVEHGASSDLQGYEEIDCQINGEYSIGCRKEGGEIYLPFSFLHKYFEVCYVQTDFIHFKHLFYVKYQIQIYFHFMK